MKAKCLDFHVRVNLHNWLDDSVFRGLGCLKHFAIWKIRGRQRIANGSPVGYVWVPKFRRIWPERQFVLITLTAI